jgi:hypothetical protein
VADEIARMVILKVERLNVERLKVKRVKVERLMAEMLKVERTRRPALARGLLQPAVGKPLSGPLHKICCPLLQL